MDIRNCRQCGGIYVYDNFNICPKCRKQEEEDFQKVKKYLYENPDANISEVSEETGVETKKIISFLKQGRLEIKDENNSILTCERCGKSIRTGRFCKKCVADMDREFKKAIGGGKDPSELQNSDAREKMRIKERYRNGKSS